MFSQLTTFGKTQFYESSHFDHKITALAANGCSNSAWCRSSRTSGWRGILCLWHPDRSSPITAHLDRAGRVYPSGSGVVYEPLRGFVQGQASGSHPSHVCADDSVFDRHWLGEWTQFERADCNPADGCCCVCGGATTQQTRWRKDESQSLGF